jgi:hypothetical protein
MEEQPELQHQPLRSISLTPDQNAALNEEAAGDFGAKFVVISRETHPGDPQRWRLWIVPSTARRVNAAIKKLMLRPNQGH